MAHFRVSRAKAFSNEQYKIKKYSHAMQAKVNVT